MAQRREKGKGLGKGLGPLSGMVKDNFVGIRDFLGETTEATTRGLGNLANLSKPRDLRTTAPAKKDEIRKRQVRMKMRNIFAAPLMAHHEKQSVAEHKKTAEETAFLKDALCECFVFDNLSNMERSTLIKAMMRHSVEKGETVIKQGDTKSDYFYVIGSGNVKFLVDGKPVGTASKGKAFGELALMYDCPRAATCVATTKCDLWRVDQHTFKIIRANHVLEVDQGAKNLLMKVKFLEGLDENLIGHLASAMTLTLYKKGEKLPAGDSDDTNFYIVKDGKIKATNIKQGGCDYEDKIFESGEYFGSRHLIKMPKFGTGDVVALEDAAVYILPSDAFRKILGNVSLEEKIASTVRRIKMRLIPALAGLEETEYDALVSQVEVKHFKKGHKFCTKGEHTEPAVYIIRKGTMSIVEDGKVKVLTEGAYFGDQNIDWEHIDNKSSILPAKICAKAEVDCEMGILTLAAIESVVVDLHRLRGSRGKKRLVQSSIVLPSIERHRLLGAGTFGQVWLVTKQRDPTPYALKVQYKREIIGYGQVDGVLREKSVMTEFDHPFVLRLVETYQDPNCIYMLMDLVQGGEMYNIIHTDNRDGLSENVSKFYAANILEGLSHMHRKNIIHRDLKFENIMMSKDGFCVLIDFGFAKKIKHKTYTFCGTPLFIAPEVVLSEGHNKGADIWSYGVLLFEMVTGENPFYMEGMDQMALFKSIVRGEFFFPEDIELSRSCKILITNLLITEPEYRLGCHGNGDMDIRKAPWFTGIDFRKILRKEYRAPWVPKIKDPFDASNFEDWTQLEKKKKSLEPLSQKEQLLFKDF